jgi:hypothetical protein
VLIHVAERAEVLRRLVTALRPGGWIVIEDFDAASLLPDPRSFEHEVDLPTADAVRRWLSAGGCDATFGRKLYGRFRDLGLCDVSAEGRVLMLDAANGGAELTRVNLEQMGSALVAAGLSTEAQLQTDLLRIRSPGFAALSPVMWTVSGRRSATQGDCQSQGARAGEDPSRP